MRKWQEVADLADYRNVITKPDYENKEQEEKQISKRQQMTIITVFFMYVLLTGFCGYTYAYFYSERGNYSNVFAMAGNQDILELSTGCTTICKEASCKNEHEAYYSNDDSPRINFGTIKDPGMKQLRDMLKLKNKLGIPVKVEIFVTGPIIEVISDWTKTITLNPVSGLYSDKESGEWQEIDFWLNRDAANGEYSGTIIITAMNGYLKISVPARVIVDINIEKSDGSQVDREVYSEKNTTVEDPQSVIGEEAKSPEQPVEDSVNNTVPTTDQGAATEDLGQTTVSSDTVQEPQSPGEIGVSDEEQNFVEPDLVVPIM
jgi:hypothetical protein